MIIKVYNISIDMKIGLIEAGFIVIECEAL